MSRRQRPKPGRVQPPLVGIVVSQGSDARERRVRMISAALKGYLTDLGPDAKVSHIDVHDLANWLVLTVGDGRG